MGSSSVSEQVYQRLIAEHFKGDIMSFIRRQIGQIRAGGLPVLRRKVGNFLRWLSINKYLLLLAFYGYKLAVTFKPNWVAARVRLGEALGRLNRFDEAIACWKKVVSLKPDCSKAYEGLGDALLGLDRFEEGIACWRKAISLQPDDRYLDLYRRSLKLVHRGQWDAMVNILWMGMETQEEFEQAHQLNKLGIRFLREWTYAIGHMALLDFYVKMGILGWRSPYRSIVLDAKPANRCYLDYWRRYLPDMITDPEGVERLTPLAARLEEHLHVVTFADGQKVYFTAAAAVQEQWEAEGRGPLLTLTDLDHERGWDCLQRLGVPPEAWFVGLHVRHTGFGNVRDSDISTYRLAIESIVARGGWVIRMGNPSMPPLPPMPKVIDYSHSEVRSDWMDVFLWARCRFFIGTRSGPAHVPPTFGVPCVLTNAFPVVTPIPYRQNIGIFKLYWSEAEERYLTFREAFASRVELAESADYLASVGIRQVDNTPEEINGVVLEMLERLEGTLTYSDEDEQLQARFKRLKPNFTSQLGVSAGRVGRDFLRKWAHLL